MAKKTYYFPHDFHARHDHKMVKLRQVHGMAGYGAYWLIVEVLWELDSEMYFDNLEVLSFESGLDVETLENIITEFELFEFDDEKFWSESQKTRKTKMLEIQAKRKAAGALGGHQKSINNGGLYEK